ncbi:MAG: pantothenate kinase [Clostridia bacterium]|nr:pantothenate kinase [Clostridia bacterium]
MAMTLGVDVGGSTTKIVGLDGGIIGALQVRAGDQQTSLFGAIGHFLHKFDRSLEQVEKIVLTGVGAALIEEDIYGIPTVKVNEFEAIGRGGLLLSGEQKALIVSMGTGTAFVYAEGDQVRHVGGSGVGGGTLIGLSSKLLGVKEIDAILDLAKDGDLSMVDLSIGEISNGEVSNLPSTATAANFGHVKPCAKAGDFALGLLNMIYQTVGVLAGFYCKERQIKKVVFTGSLAALPQAKEMLEAVGALYDLEFIIPENEIFATAIGAASLQ